MAGTSRTLPGIAASGFRHRVIVQKPVQVQDPTTGAVTPSWTEVCRLWAAIQPLSARDFVAAQAAQSEVMARIVIRFRDDIAAGMRILHSGKTYIIEGVLADPDSGREYLTLPVSEGARQE